MGLVFVERIGGVVAGVYANKQPGRAEESLDESHPDVIGYFHPAPSASDVNKERDRRASKFVFAGKTYDLSGESLLNVSGAGTLALAAIINGAQPGDLRWADPDEDFSWIADDNTSVVMDAQTAWAFAQTAAAWRKHVIFKARVIKDMNQIPTDYAKDSHWV